MGNKDDKYIVRGGREAKMIRSRTSISRKPDVSMCMFLASRRGKKDIISQDVYLELKSLGGEIALLKGQNMKDILTL